jgi:hypothetical protein
MPVTFSGDPTPIEPGDYTYTADSAFVLDPNTTYWAVLSVPHNGVHSQLYIAMTSDLSEAGMPGWSIGNAVAVQTTIQFGQPLPWFANSGLSLYLAVDAIAVPEPSTSAAAVMTIGAVLVSGSRRRSRKRLPVA